MDKCGEHLGLESQRMENKEEVFPVPESAELLEMVAFWVAVTTLIFFPLPKHRESNP